MTARQKNVSPEVKFEMSAFIYGVVINEPAAERFGKALPWSIITVKHSVTPPCGAKQSTSETETVIVVKVVEWLREKDPLTFLLFKVSE